VYEVRFLQVDTAASSACICLKRPSNENRVFSETTEFLHNIFAII